MEINNEKEVADRAVRMLEASLKTKTSSFRDHARGVGDVSLKNSRAVATVKRYGKKKDDTQVFFMRKLSIKMPRHGFVQHFGVSTIRASGHRTRKTPKETTYGYKAHFFGMKARPFIDSAIRDSRVVPFVMEHISKIRSEEIIVSIKKILEKKT